jgi:hypothetical protein
MGSRCCEDAMPDVQCHVCSNQHCATHNCLIYQGSSRSYVCKSHLTRVNCTKCRQPIGFRPGRQCAAPKCFTNVCPHHQIEGVLVCPKHERSCVGCGRAYAAIGRRSLGDLYCASCHAGCALYLAWRRHSRTLDLDVVQWMEKRLSVPPPPPG